jgi:predicted  nucleic acid-binding Zn-ribbon protein
VELAQLRENCDGLRAARDAAHNELRVVQDELRDTQDEVSCAQNELGGVQDELGGAQDELVSIQNELSSVQDDLLRAAAELSDVTSKRDACQAQLDAIRRSREEVSSELTTRKAELHQCTEAYRSEHGRLWDLRGEVGNLTKSLERTQQALSDAERRAKREEDDARARLSRLRGEIQKTEEVLAIRKKQAHDQHHRYSTLLAEVQSSLSAAKREKAHEIFRLEADANAVRDSIARLRNEDRIAKAELLRTHRSHEEANTALAVAVAQKEAAEVDAQAATVAAARSQGVARRAQESLASLKAQIQDAASLLEHTKTRSPPASQDFVSSLCTRADAEQSTPIAPPTPQASMPEQDGAPANHMPGATLKFSPMSRPNDSSGSIDPPEHRPAPQDTGSGGLFNRLGGWIGRGSLSTPAAPPAASPTTKPPGHTHATPTSTPKNADVHAKVATRTHDGSKSEATSGLSETPDTRRTSSPARRSVSAAPGASKPGASAPAMVQEPSPTTVFSEASKDLASTPIILASQGASVRKSVPTPKSEQVRPNVAHPTSESHASQQRPPQDQALSPTSKTKSVPSPSDERAQSTASASLDNSGNEGVAAAITSHPEEPNAGAGLSSSSPTADTSKGRNKTSTPTDDETEGPTEATTKPATAGSCHAFDGSARAHEPRREC